MANNNGVEFKINRDPEKYTEESIYKALEMIGLKAESYAKMKCPVDTGLLRNSIAHAVSGEVPSIGESYKGTAKKARTYTANKPNDEGKIEKGTYTLHTPRSKNNPAVFFGSNTEYAAYVEMGHRQNVGQFVPKLGKRLVAPEVKPQPFIKPALFDHIDEYEAILDAVLVEAFNDDN